MMKYLKSHANLQISILLFGLLCFMSAQATGWICEDGHISNLTTAICPKCGKDQLDSQLWNIPIDEILQPNASTASPLNLYKSCFEYIDSLRKSRSYQKRNSKIELKTPDANAFTRAITDQEKALMPTLLVLAHRQNPVSDDYESNLENLFEEVQAGRLPEVTDELNSSLGGDLKSALDILSKWMVAIDPAATALLEVAAKPTTQLLEPLDIKNDPAQDLVVIKDGIPAPYKIVRITGTGTAIQLYRSESTGDYSFHLGAISIKNLTASDLFGLFDYLQENSEFSEQQEQVNGLQLSPPARFQTEPITSDENPQAGSQIIKITNAGTGTLK
ncbi:hypothetical protein M3P05_02595 [Sansalvadorimonas sp. 2012CJ34-2]|uniref:Uncharacterized protein n=1 Tax=Parendozoicomonas callyspongiae TaxID=2942213 RepID=A0ABT0PBT7_9GAMM|nr:hypothetical protein [Sansalvadorimonas sp. 2012CJ34-2]MCL6268839.1 hypothetical protein [Sansalvadorimonas sp. 2012CJ34-2]